MAVGSPALALLWASLVAPRLGRLPDDFRYEADLYSRDDIYDEAQGRYSGEVLSHTRFSYEAVSRQGEVLTVRNVFDVRRPTGEKIFAVERLYGIDRNTGRHVASAGDARRDGYLFAPRGAGREPFTYWHINYDAPARMVFEGQEEIGGVLVHRYACDYRADQTADLGHLPGVPATRGVELEIRLELWVEPRSGWMVKYEDHATAYYYDQRTRQRLHPWNRFRNQYTEASVADQARHAQSARRRAFWAGAPGTAMAGVAAALSLSWALGLRPRAFSWSRLGALGGEALRRRVALSSAAACAALGAAVMAGWLFPLPRLVRTSPEYAPMQFNTALGLAVSGVALWAHLARRRRWSVGASLLVGALGIATSIEYVLGRDLGLDQLFVHATLSTATPHPGRMAPVTALCFALVGPALALAGRPRATLPVGVSGSLVAALGGVALLGYALGLPQAYRMGPWTGMAPQTATGFVLLGAGLMALAWPSWKARTAPRWLAAFGTIGGLCLLLVLYHALDSREDAQVRSLLQAEASRAAVRAADRMAERMLALDRMARRWEAAGGQDETRWARDAARYVADFPGFQAVSWVDTSSRVRWIVPLAGNEAALDFDLTSEKSRRQALEEAARTRGVTVSSPLDLIQGGRGFLVFAPISLPGGRSDGYINGVFRYDKLMDHLVREIAAQGHAVSLWDGEELLYRHGPRQPLPAEWTVEQPVRFQEQRSPASAGAHEAVWLLRLAPRPEWVASVRSPLPEVTLGSGVVVLALASLSLAFAWRAARRAEELKGERAAALDLAQEAHVARDAAEAAERRIADSLREKEVLLQEVHHRVKNNLQVISSLINMQVRQIEDQAGRAALAECQSRVQAIALIHEKLYESSDYAKVPFADYVRGLALDVHHAGGVSSVSLDLDLEEVALSVDKAIPCGLILNELMTNALRHGLRDGHAGAIRVELRKLPEARLCLAVSDDGVGLPDGFDIRASRTLGLQLVHMLTDQLRGEIEISAKAGTSFRVIIPLEEAQERPAPA